MSQDKPTLFPRWASSPPAAPPTTITEPTSAQKDSGWQPSGSAEFPDGHPVRQIANWLENLEYQWVQWLDQSGYRTSDQHPDQPFPDSTPNIPSTGVGLGPIAAGDFAASVYADGYRVPETDSPIHTYAATSDTYWDLGRDAAWTFSVVASGGGAPAVAANSTRVFAVRTDAIDRTSVILDNLTPHATLDVNRVIRHLASLDLAGVLNLGVDSDDAGTGFLPFSPRITAVGTGGDRYWQLAEFDNEDAGILTVRVYLGVFSEPNQITIVWGARHLAGGTNWESDANATDVFRLVFGGHDTDNQFHFKASQIIGIGVSTTFAENDWDSQDQAGQKQQINMLSGLRLGQNLNTGVAASINSVAHLEHLRDDISARHSLIRIDATSTVKLREYHTLNAFGTAVLGRILTWNASWNEATGLWNRDDNAQNSFMRIDWQSGVYSLFHLSGESATWTDTTTPVTGWTTMQSQGPLAGSTRDIFPAITLAAAFQPGAVHGYGQPITMRRIFTAMHGQIDSNDLISGDGRFASMNPITANAGRVEFNSPGSDTELLIPFQMPHESIITKVEVLLWNGIIGTPEIAVWRDDLDDVSGLGAWSRLQSGGNDTSIPLASAARIWHSVLGLDTALTMNNIRYRYAIMCLGLSGQQTFIQAARVTATVPFNAAF